MLEGKMADLLEALCSHNDLQMVADKAALVLNNPVALFDSSYYVLVYSAIHDARDYVWNAGLQRGFCTYEYISLIHSVVPSHEGENKNSYAISGEVSDVRRMLGKLVVNSAVMGYFAVLESNAPLEETTGEVYDMVAKILAKAVSTERSMLYYRKSLTHESILIDLLGSGTANRQLYRERIRGSEFEGPATYQLYCIDMTRFPLGNMAEPSLKATMQRKLPSSWSVYDQQFIVILANIDDARYQQEDVLEEWKRFLRANKLRAGCSDSFTDLFLLPGYYTQSRRALELGVMMGDERILIPYDEYKLLNAISQLSPGQLKNDYCSVAIRAILDSDGRHNTEYMKTLYCYLKCGKNLKETAAKLHVHRNTIIYRIDKIKEKFGIDFKDEKENLHSYFSCMVLQYQAHLN